MRTHSPYVDSVIGRRLCDLERALRRNHPLPPLPAHFRGATVHRRHLAALTEAHPTALIPHLPPAWAAETLRTLTVAPDGLWLPGHLPDLKVGLGLIARLIPQDRRDRVNHTLVHAAINLGSIRTRRVAQRRRLLQALLPLIAWPPSPWNTQLPHQGWEVLPAAITAGTFPEVYALMAPYMDMAAQHPSCSLLVRASAKGADEDKPPFYGLAAHPDAWRWLLATTPPAVLGYQAADTCIWGRRDEMRLLIRAGALSWDWPMAALLARAQAADANGYAEPGEPGRVAQFVAAITHAVDDRRRSAAERSKLYEACRCIGDVAMTHRYRAEQLAQVPAMTPGRRRVRA